AERSSVRAFDGNYSLRMVNPFALPVSSSLDCHANLSDLADIVGMECWFSYNQTIQNNPTQLIPFVSLECWDGTNRREGQVRIIPGSNDLQIISGSPPT